MPFGLNPITVFRAAESATAKATEEKIQSAFTIFAGGALAGAATKGVGSGFRVYDDQYAPKDVRKSTLRREGLTVALTSGCSGVVKVAFSNILKHLKASSNAEVKAAAEKLLAKESFITVGLISMGSMAAEIISRKVAPRKVWDKNGNLIASGNQAVPIANVAHSSLPEGRSSLPHYAGLNPFNQVEQGTSAAFW